MGRPKEERRSTGIELGSLSNKKREPKALLIHQAFRVSSAAVKFDPQSMEEQRQSISYDAVIDKLVREIGRLLRKDAILLTRSPYTGSPISIRIGVPTSAPSVLTTSAHSGKRWKVCWRFMSSTRVSAGWIILSPHGLGLIAGT